MKNRVERYTAFLLMSAAAWGAAILLILLMVYCLLHVRNPWIVHSLDAETDIARELAETADSPSPYVRIRNMDLTYTGYYEADSEGTVLAYCYFGALGDSNVLVGLPAGDAGALAGDSGAAGAYIQDASFAGRVITGTEMTEHLAQGEGMQLQDYIRQYHMSGMEIFSYKNDRERIVIYHLMVLVGIIGCAAAGGILRAEAAAVLREAEEEEASSARETEQDACLQQERDSQEE